VDIHGSSGTTLRKRGIDARTRFDGTHEFTKVRVIKSSVASPSAHFGLGRVDEARSNSAWSSAWSPGRQIVAPPRRGNPSAAKSVPSQRSSP
jgi:hypothetical protein